MENHGKDAAQQQSERQTQTAILEYLKTVKDCWTVKVVMCNQRGCPDILCCHKGQFIGIEVKSKDGRLSAIQLLQAGLIKKAGGTCIVARGVDDVKGVVQ